MNSKGRDKEIAEIVETLRACQVARVMLGYPNPISPVFPEMLKDWSRIKIQAERSRVREDLRIELKKFQQQNFPNLKKQQLAQLYLHFYKNKHYQAPLVEFEKFVGGSKAKVFAGVPRHATVHISIPWGLQTQFPEHLLMKDIAIIYNNLRSNHKQLSNFKTRKQSELITDDTRLEINKLAIATYSRMCLISCFNLLEAYINGIAWDYNYSYGTSMLTSKQIKMITESSESLVNRIIEIPHIIAKQKFPKKNISIFKEDDPLIKDFIELIKPYRDSIVHASPFSVPEKFGGYSKLDKIYNLEVATVDKAINIIRDIISRIHVSLEGKGKLPEWYYKMSSDGEFILE